MVGPSLLKLMCELHHEFFFDKVGTHSRPHDYWLVMYIWSIQVLFALVSTIKYVGKIKEFFIITLA